MVSNMIDRLAFEELMQQAKQSPLSCARFVALKMKSGSHKNEALQLISQRYQLREDQTTAQELFLLCQAVGQERIDGNLELFNPEAKLEELKQKLGQEELLEAIELIRTIISPKFKIIALLEVDDFVYQSRENQLSSQEKEALATVVNEHYQLLQALKLHGTFRSKYNLYSRFFRWGFNLGMVLLAAWVIGKLV